MTAIHQTAVVDGRAELGADVTVGPYAVIEGQVTIGDGCQIGPRACILRYTELGPRCVVHAGAVLGGAPQDVRFAGGRSYVTLGAEVVVREGVTVHRGTGPESATTIGDHCLLMVNAHVGHNGRLGSGVVLANGALIAGHATVGEGAFVSGYCLVHQFVAIGRLAMLGGGAGVSMDVPPFCTVTPCRLNRLSGLNTVGLRRAGISQDARTALKRAFRTLFRARLPVSAALERLAAEHKTVEVQELAAFVTRSTRGVCR